MENIWKKKRNCVELVGCGIFALSTGNINGPRFQPLRQGPKWLMIVSKICFNFTEQNHTNRHKFRDTSAADPRFPQPGNETHKKDLEPHLHAVVVAYWRWMEGRASYID